MIKVARTHTHTNTPTHTQDNTDTALCEDILLTHWENVWQVFLETLLDCVYENTHTSNQQRKTPTNYHLI